MIFADKSASNEEEGGILLAQLMTLSCLLAAIFYLINGLKSSYTLQAGVVLLRYLMIGPPLGTPIDKLRKSRQTKGSNQLLFATSLFGLRSSTIRMGSLVIEAIKLMTFDYDDDETVVILIWWSNFVAII